ncbi:MAG: hypothetical protein MUF24_12660 [Chitinophagaceae bacterium]|nr:hypothetical protein [Chitinophagaceae bacterium]
MFKLPAIWFGLLSATLAGAQQPQNPLSAYGTEWNNPRYAACNTAAGARYMTAAEKEVIFIMNLMRQYPQQFLTLVVKNWPDSSYRNYWKDNTYYASLLTDLQKMKPAPLLQPDSVLWVSASCHAKTSGLSGYTGHQRQTPECKSKERFLGECCDYGSSKPLDIVMSLLIDEGVESLGHRKILMDNKYTGAAASIMPHKKYRIGTVINFR